MKRSTAVLALALGLTGFTAMAQDQEGPPPGERPPFREGGPPGGPPGRFMRGQENGPGRMGPRGFLPPIMAALDANGDGIIDKKEISNASKALKKLDKNRDGKLTPDEYRPQNLQGMAGPRGQFGPGGPGGPDRPPWRGQWRGQGAPGMRGPRPGPSDSEGPPPGMDKQPQAPGSPPPSGE